MLKSIFTDTVSSSVSIEAMLICTLVSIILGIVIAFTHKATSKYSKNFLITLAILPVLVQIIMIMVNGNLGTSLAIAGAFGLVKFRSLPGTSKEILSVFFAMSIGLATGMGHIFLASMMTIIISICIILLCKIKMFNPNNTEKILKIIVPESLDYTNMFDDIFASFTKAVKLEQAKTINMGSLFELTYRVSLKSDSNEKEFIDAIRVKNGNLKVALSLDINNNEM